MILTRARVEQLLENIISEFGTSYVDPSSVADPERVTQCAYHNRQVDDEIYPSCAVGQLLSRVGMQNYALQGLGGLSVRGLAEARRLSSYRIALTPEALRFLDIFQESQDNGTPWGECLSIAQQEVDTLYSRT